MHRSGILKGQGPWAPYCLPYPHSSKLACHACGNHTQQPQRRQHYCWFPCKCTGLAHPASAWDMASFPPHFWGEHTSQHDFPSSPLQHLPTHLVCL